DRAGTEGDHAALALQAPAKIHVVTGFKVFRIKSADALEGTAMKGHVAPRHVLGHDIAEQHVAWPTRRRGHGSLNPVRRGRRNIWSANTRIVAAEQSFNEVIQPVGLGH